MPADLTSIASLQFLVARKEWPPEQRKVIEPVLIRLGARFLAVESGRDKKRAADPVAHFHLSNGARIERINWRADTSPKGMRESSGMMVNYLYDLKFIEDNHEAYAGEGKRAMATGVRKLTKG